MLDYPWWVLLFFVLGVLATIAAVTTLFTAWGRRPPEVWVVDPPEVGSKDFLLGISGSLNAPLESGGGARLLNNGDEFFPAMVEAFRSAEKSINFSAYIWEPGKVSEMMTEVLSERARAGVPVRILLDGMGGLRAPEEHLERLREAGAEVETFRPFRLGKITRFYKRNHRRAIVVDGKVGFTGGAAVGDKWLGDARNPDEWRDIMVEITGCGASNLQSGFTQLWGSVCGELLMGPAYYPHEEEMETRGEEISHHVNIISSPSDDSYPLRKFFYISFAGGRERIYVTSPYFVPDDETREVLRARAQDGVDVRILLPNEHTDAKPIRWASHRYYEELLEGGVRVYEYQKTMIHSKTVVIDGIWCIVGSANMDIRSQELNQENVIGMLDRGFGEELERTFLVDLEDAKEMDLDEWRRRGLGARLLERAAATFAEQY